jgi:crossover junction endonuclease EME1
MPPVVIDLLSSPDFPPPTTRLKVTNARARGLTYEKEVPKAKSANVKVNGGTQKDGWFVLSSEDDGFEVGSFLVTSPKKMGKTTTAARPVVNSDAISKLSTVAKPAAYVEAAAKWSATATTAAKVGNNDGKKDLGLAMGLMKPSWSFGNIDKANVKQTAKTGDGGSVEGRVVKSAEMTGSTVLKEISDSVYNAQVLKPVETAKHGQTKKKTNDFYFMEDDFDSTVNFDESFAPPPKKRKVSESPKGKVVPANSILNTTRPRESPKAKTVSDISGSGSTAKPRENGHKRSISNIESSTTAKAKAQTGRNVSAPSLKRANTSTSTSNRHTVQEEDPILFTSSPDPILDAARRRREKAKKNAEADVFGFMSLSEDDGEVEKADTKPKGKSKSNLAGFYVLSSDMDDVVNLKPPAKKGKESPKNISKPEKRNSYDPFGFEDSSDIELPVSKARNGERSISSKSTGFSIDLSSDLELPPTGAVKGKQKSNPKKPEDVLAKYEATKAKEKAAKAKADAKAAREVERGEAKVAKEAEKEERRLAKEQKARDKQREKELEAVNKLKIDRKETTTEMIVDLPSSLEKKLEGQIHAFLDTEKIEYHEYESPQPIIKWRRKVASEFDEEKEHWVPLARPTIKSEKHILYVITAKQFVDLVLEDEGHDVNALMLGLRAKFDSHEIIFLLEGWIPWIRKNRNIQDKKWKEAVASHGTNDQQPTATQRGRKKKQDEYVDEGKAEDAMLRLQIEHGVLIHHTSAMLDTALWVKVFTENISTIPYKYVLSPPLPYLMT